MPGVGPIVVLAISRKMERPQHQAPSINGLLCNGRNMQSNAFAAAKSVGSAPTLPSGDFGKLEAASSQRGRRTVYRCLRSTRPRAGSSKTKQRHERGYHAPQDVRGCQSKVKGIIWEFFSITRGARNSARATRADTLYVSSFESIW